MADSVCGSCRHGLGFHLCRNPNNRQHFLWRKGTLHAGGLDVQRVLFNLHRKLLPNAALEENWIAYARAGQIDEGVAKRVIQCIFKESGITTYLNNGVEEVSEDAAVQTLSTKLSPDALKALLGKRVGMVQDGRAGDGVTDQFRVYAHIVHCIGYGHFLRLMVEMLHHFFMIYTTTPRVVTIGT